MWKPLPKGGGHAPIVLVNGKIIFQGRRLNRACWPKRHRSRDVRNAMTGNHISQDRLPARSAPKGYLAER